LLRQIEGEKLEGVKYLLSVSLVERETSMAPIRNFSHNPELHSKIHSQFPAVTIQYVSHEEFKKMTSHCKAVIRTGEATPYANIILYSGVNF